MELCLEASNFTRHTLHLLQLSALYCCLFCPLLAHPLDLVILRTLNTHLHALPRLLAGLDLYELLRVFCQ